MHLAGRREQPLFVSVLLHGNETTGLHAVQMLLKKYVHRPLPRALSIFVGNVHAARAGLRRLDNQVDYNRIWPGTEHSSRPETAMAQWVVEEMVKRNVFTSIDVHNNTGLNPHYACVNRLDCRSLQLAAMFGRLCIYSTHPRGTQTAAFAEICPAVTLECGKPGHAYGAEHAFDYLDGCLHLDHIPDQPVASHDLELYESVAQVFVSPGVDFGFANDSADLNFMSDLDRLNFRPVPAGFVLGQVRTGHVPLRVCNGSGEDVADYYFRVEDGQLLLTKALMPSMLTLDELVIRQDCLGYLMERRVTEGQE